MNHNQISQDLQTSEANWITWIRNPLTAGQMGRVWERNENSNKDSQHTSQNTQKFERCSTTQIPDRSWSNCHFMTNDN